MMLTRDQLIEALKNEDKTAIIKHNKAYDEAFQEMKKLDLHQMK